MTCLPATCVNPMTDRPATRLTMSTDETSYRPLVITDDKLMVVSSEQLDRLCVGLPAEQIQKMQKRIQREKSDDGADEYEDKD